MRGSLFNDNDSEEWSRPRTGKDAVGFTFLFVPWLPEFVFLRFPAKVAFVVRPSVGPNFFEGGSSVARSMFF